MKSKKIESFEDKDVTVMRKSRNTRTKKKSKNRSPSPSLPHPIKQTSSLPIITHPPSHLTVTPHAVPSQTSHPTIFVVIKRSSEKGREIEVGLLGVDERERGLVGRDPVVEEKIVHSRSVAILLFQSTSVVDQQQCKISPQTQTSIRKSCPYHLLSIIPPISPLNITTSTQT